MSKIIDPTVVTGSVTIKTKITEDGAQEKSIEIDPSPKGAVAGATVGAAVGATLGPVGAVVGGVLGGIIGGIFGPGT